MNKLPEGWASTSLGELATWGSGGTPSRNQPHFYQGHIPWIKSGELNSRYVTETEEKISEAALNSSSAKIFPAGSVAIAMYGATIGKTAILGIRAATNQACAVGTPTEGLIQPEFLHRLLQSEKKLFIEKGKGGAQPNISQAVIKSHEVNIPPFLEQSRIVHALDGLLAQVDTLKARLDAVPSLIKRFRQSVLNAAASGNLSKDWRTQNPSLTADEMLKDFVPLPEPPRYKTRSDAFIAGVCATAVGKPEHRIVPTWVWMPLVKVARMESGHTPSKAVQEYWGGGIPWIGIKDANANHQKTIYKTLNNTNQAGLDNSAARLLPAGTVCVSRTASVGYVVKMGTLMSTSQDFVNWVPTDYIDPEWLKWLFVAEKESLYRFGKGTTHTTIYFPEWLSLHVAIPHIEEQRFIAQRAEQLLNYADGLSARVDDARVRINALAQSILAKAFRGELVPQDPNDEPASVLLERIAAQRAADPKPKRGRKAAAH